MKSGVNDFEKIKIMAKKDAEGALQYAYSLGDSYYKCISLTFASTKFDNIHRKLEILNDALSEAKNERKKSEKLLAAIYPLRQLSELNQTGRVKAEVHQLLEDMKPFQGTVEYLECLFQLVGSIHLIGSENFPELFSCIRSECEKCTHNKKDIMLSRMVPFFYHLNQDFANDMLFLIDGDKPRKKAEKELERATNFNIDDYFAELQFK